MRQANLNLARAVASADISENFSFLGLQKIKQISRIQILNSCLLQCNCAKQRRMRKFVNFAVKSIFHFSLSCVKKKNFERKCKLSRKFNLCTEEFEEHYVYTILYFFTEINIIVSHAKSLTDVLTCNLTYLLEKNIKIIIVRTVIITTTIILSFFIAFCVFEQGYITESFFF